MKTGQHQARCIEAALCASGSGTEYVGINCEIVDGECKGETIAGKLFWTEKTQERTKASLALLGWRGEVDRDAKLVGLTNTVPIGVTEEEYPAGSGKKQMKVDWVGTPPVSGIKSADRLTMSAAKRFAAELSGKSSNGGGTGGFDPRPRGNGRTQSGYAQGDAYEDDI
jgi:hypothetical protein